MAKCVEFGTGPSGLKRCMKYGRGRNRTWQLAIPPSAAEVTAAEYTAIKEAPPGIMAAKEHVPPEVETGVPWLNSIGRRRR